jgi:hypothetical protein
VVVRELEARQVVRALRNMMIVLVGRWWWVSMNPEKGGQ